jgi:catechol-2,3-dioxygenase
MGFTNLGIDHVEVYVRDLEASARWYAQVLGLRELARWEPEPVMIGPGQMSGTKLALFRAKGAPADPASEARAVRWHRVAWQTDRAGFEAAQAHLRSLGISFRGPVDHGRSHSIYFTDPDWNPLEITVNL